MTAMSYRSVIVVHSASGIGDALVMVDHLGDDEPQELLGERRVEPGFDGERAQPRDLGRLAVQVGRWQPDLRPCTHRPPG